MIVKASCTNLQDTNKGLISIVYMPEVKQQVDYGEKQNVCTGQASACEITKTVVKSREGSRRVPIFISMLVQLDVLVNWGSVPA